ncbi:DUF1289 domain-containing protein [Azospirillum halopraeferens]|uniref:DUF1289 domain-containing protein n=1 Tax=Azospirillum halopraeferens TaxID=34010 RepID=UPI0003F95FD6|nr:DUF1289 domain-containing protein [Azospirillum halopraeferens]
MAKHDTGNPCTGVCRFDAAGLCRGCLRSRPEVRTWKRLDDDAKAAINRRCTLDRKIARAEAKLARLRGKRAALDPADAGLRLFRP